MCTPMTNTVHNGFTQQYHISGNFRNSGYRKIHPSHPETLRKSDVPRMKWSEVIVRKVQEILSGSWSIPVYLHWPWFSYPYVWPLREFLPLTWAHRRVALPANVQISVFFKILFYGYSQRSYSIKHGMFEKMKARTFRWVILLRPFAFESRMFFLKYNTTVLVHRHEHASWPSTSCLVRHRQWRKA